MRIAITGASGFIGEPLQLELRRAGHTVLTVGRARSRGVRPDVAWDPVAGTIEAEKLEGIEALVHLSAENVGQRWTPRARRAIRQSRVLGTALIARTLASLGRAPHAMVSASAAGYYGNRGDEVLDEASAGGQGFLADVAREWEGAAAPARAAGIRVAHARLGVVLHRGGGALARLVPIFSSGIGGQVGDGRQWMSWIARADVVAALRFLVETPFLDGPVNVVAPEPARNADFTAALARALHRPAVIPVPAFAIRLLYGEMGVESVVWGQRVHPRRLLEAGFRFAFPTLDAALRAAMA